MIYDTTDSSSTTVCNPLEIKDITELLTKCLKNTLNMPVFNHYRKTRVSFFILSAFNL